MEEHAGVCPNHGRCVARTRATVDDALFDQTFFWTAGIPSPISSEFRHVFCSTCFLSSSGCTFSLVKTRCCLRRHRVVYQARRVYVKKKWLVHLYRSMRPRLLAFLHSPPLSTRSASNIAQGGGYLAFYQYIWYICGSCYFTHPFLQLVYDLTKITAHLSGLKSLCKQQPGSSGVIMRTVRWQTVSRKMARSM